MAQLYAIFIKNHRFNLKTRKSWCIEDVPAKYREEVEKILNQ